MISIVVATDKNRVIGRENKIPWRLRSDLIHLKDLTKGRTVILGRVSYDSMVWYYNKSGKTMPGKAYIVVTRNAHFAPARDNALVAHSIEEAIEIAERLGDEKILAIGGSGIYEAILPFTDRIYLTEVQAEVEGDAYFPQLTEEWQETAREHHRKDESNEYDFDFVTLERKNRAH